MAFSYSLHLSAKSHAVGTVGKLGQVSRHNLREYESKEYDRDNIEILRGSSESISNDVKQIYHDEFDAALEKYNEGKRADRRINDYLKHVSDSRSDVACELIIQIGDQDFWQNKTLTERKQMTGIFEDQLRALSELVPELKIASAVIHYDEKSPHMHVVGVPVADGYKKGLEKQVAKTRVFTADRLSELQDRMRDAAEKAMEKPQYRDLFEGMELKAKEQGRNKDIPKESLQEFYKLEDDIHELKADVNEKQGELEWTNSRLSDAQEEKQKVENSIQHAKEQKLEALRARDAARAGRDLVYAVKSSINDVSRVEPIEVGVLHRIAFKNPFTGKKTALVTVREDEFNTLNRQANAINIARQLEKSLKTSFLGLQEKAAEINQNRIDSFNITRDKVTKQLLRQIDDLKRDLAKLDQALQKEQSKTKQLSRQIERLQDKAKRVDELEKENTTMRDYMSSVRFQDGHTVLDSYERKKRKAKGRHADYDRDRDRDDGFDR